ncbi:hypothetical protein LSAT2_015438 [Lamellibrachia satsuma]|nr:hypothetical protein LSAT2_015438 [Lamellibrachia satsuma]
MSLVSALPEQLSASSEKVATRGGGACIMSAPVTDKQHGFHSNRWFVNGIGGNGFTGTRPYSIDNEECPVHLVNCVSSCEGKANDQYQSCLSCNSYVSCYDGMIHDNQPCPRGLIWDDVKKYCDWTSTTCIPCTGELTAGSPLVTCLLAHKAETGCLHFCWPEACYGQSISKRYSVTFRRHTVTRPNVPLFFPIIIVVIMTVP